jgi:Mrp family chromosome partitioning ATPase
MVELLETASNNYDHIIIDGPPVLGLSDALVIANIADATIFTVEAGRTQKARLIDSLKRLERANANIVGSVLMRISSKINPDYNQEYYAYSSEQRNKH